MEIEKLPVAQNKYGEAFLKHCPSIVGMIPSSPVANMDFRFAQAALREVNKLQGDIEPASVLRSVYACAIIGLIPGVPLGHAYFIPYRNKRDNGRKHCQLVIGYPGFIEMAIRSTFVTALHTEVVTKEEQNQFTYRVDSKGPQIEHNIGIRLLDVKKKDVAAAYCLYQTKGGGHGIRVVTKSEIDKVDRGVGPWDTNYVAMARKTAVRRASNEWPKTQILAQGWEAEQAALDERQIELPPEVNIDGVTTANEFNLSDLQQPTEEERAADGNDA